MENKKLKKALYLDDVRTPLNNPPEGYEPWHIVRNFTEFTEWIGENGLPDYVSFDHDLGHEHMEDYYRNQAAGIPTIDYESFTEMTGLDCAKWLVSYCIAANVHLPRLIGVHSHNPIGATNIQSFLNGYKVHTGQDENVFIAKIPHSTEPLNK